jgi:hypothetical protein
MKNLLPFLLLLLVTSCNVSKSLSRSEISTHSEVTTSQTGNANEVKNTNTDLHSVKNSQISVTADTAVTTPGSLLAGEKPLQNFLSGDSLVIDDEFSHSTVRYDSISKNLSIETTIKPRTTVVKFNRTEQISETTDLQTTQTSDLKSSAFNYLFCKLLDNMNFCNILAITCRSSNSFFII